MPANRAILIVDDNDKVVSITTIDTKNGIDVNIIGGSLAAPSAPTSVGTFTKLVTDSGTAIQLDTNTCKRVIITAFPSNKGRIAVGDSNVVAAVDSTLRGTNLFKTQSQVFFVNNTNLLYIDSTRSPGDGVSVYFEN